METPAFRPASAWQHEGPPTPARSTATSIPAVLPGLMLIGAMLLPLVTGIVVAVTFGEPGPEHVVATIVTYSAPACALAIVVGAGARSAMLTAVASIVSSVSAVTMLLLCTLGVLLLVDAVVAVTLLAAAIFGFLALRTLAGDATTRPLLAWIGLIVATAAMLGTTLAAPFLISGLHPSTVSYVALAAPVAILGLAAAVTIAGERLARGVAIVCLVLLSIALVVGIMLGGASSTVALVVSVLRIALLVAAAILLIRSRRA